MSYTKEKESLWQRTLNAIVWIDRVFIAVGALVLFKQAEFRYDQIDNPIVYQWIIPIISIIMLFVSSIWIMGSSVKNKKYPLIVLINLAILSAFTIFYIHVVFLDWVYLELV